MLPTSYRVLGKRRELGDTWTLELGPEPDGSPGVGDFRPGQFAMLYAFGSGEVPISVSGGVDGAGPLVHTVRAVGAVSQAICDTEPGERLGVRGPFGTEWPLEAARGGDVVVVTGGIGLAPLRPAIEHLAANSGDYGKVALLYGARSPDETLYPSDLERWQRAGLQVETTVDSAPVGWDGRVGLVTTLIPEADIDPARTTALVCGPEIMMRFVAQGLGDIGIAREQIHVSLERNIKCATGHCGHCQLAHRFVCKDGPVFSYDEVESLMAVRML